MRGTPHVNFPDKEMEQKQDVACIQLLSDCAVHYLNRKAIVDMGDLTLLVNLLRRESPDIVRSAALLWQSILISPQAKLMVRTEEPLFALFSL